MKRKIFMITGALTILALVFANVKVAFERNGSSNISLSTIKIAVADDEGGGIDPKCVELGQNFPGQEANSHQEYCQKSGKNETVTSCSGTGPGCQEVIWKN
jgi:hypothetical protein